MYFMRGALSRADMLDLTPWEREVIGRYINDRLEAEFKKKGANLVY